jgi:glutaredoxin
MAKEFLSKRGIEYVEFDVTKDRKALKEMVDISGSRSVPVITACEQMMIGFDPQWLEQIVNASVAKCSLAPRTFRFCGLSVFKIQRPSVLINNPPMAMLIISAPSISGGSPSR